MKICSSCGYSNPDDNRFCADCGARLSKRIESNDESSDNIEEEPVNNEPFQNDSLFAEPVPNSSVVTPTPATTAAKGHSTLSIASIVLTLTCCFFYVGLILGIVDLVNAKKENPPKNHILSIISVIVSGIMLLLCLINYPSYLKNKNDSTSATNTPTTTSTVLETEPVDVVEETVVETTTVEETTTETTTEETTTTTTTTTTETTQAKLETPCGFTLNNVDIAIETSLMDSLPFDNSLGLYDLPNGYQYLVVGAAFHNGNNYDIYVSTYDFQVYADNLLCNEEYLYEDGLESYATISSGREGIIWAVYEVPVDANIIEIEYTQDFLTDTVVITVGESSF